MTENQIDVARLLEKDRLLAPSPRDPRIMALGIAFFVCYGVAGVCAWQFGGWWGVGLVVALFIASTLDGVIHEEHRRELIEMHGKLVIEIAQNSDILKTKIPTSRSDYLG